MLIRRLGPLVLAVFCGATLLQTVRPPLPKLIYNPSRSAPVGWYRLEPGSHFNRDDRVAAFAPAEARALASDRDYLPAHIPLIKTVWAVKGDEICHVGDKVIVAGRPVLKRVSEDRFGRKLPALTGCYILKDDDIFLVSKDVQASFDSRYFGPVAVSDVLGRVHFLGRFVRRSERLRAGHG